MLKKVAHGIVVGLFHVAVLVFAHHVTVEILGLIKDEISVEGVEAITVAWLKR